MRWKRRATAQKESSNGSWKLWAIAQAENLRQTRRCSLHCVPPTNSLGTSHASNGLRRTRIFPFRSELTRLPSGQEETVAARILCRSGMNRKAAKKDYSGFCWHCLEARASLRRKPDEQAHSSKRLFGYGAVSDPGRHGKLPGCAAQSGCRSGNDVVSQRKNLYK